MLINCAVRRLIFVCCKVGVHTSTDVWYIKRIPRCPDHHINFKFTATACTFIYIPSKCMWAVKALAIFCGCAGWSEPSLFAYSTIISWTGLLHEIKYVNIKFIKTQNHATINLFLGTCMCVCAYIVLVMHS